MLEETIVSNFFHRPVLFKRSIFFSSIHFRRTTEPTPTRLSKNRFAIKSVTDSSTTTSTNYFISISYQVAQSNKDMNTATLNSQAVISPNESFPSTSNLYRINSEQSLPQAYNGYTAIETSSDSGSNESVSRIDRNKNEVVVDLGTVAEGMEVIETDNIDTNGKKSIEKEGTVGSESTVDTTEPPPLPDKRPIPKRYYSSVKLSTHRRFIALTVMFNIALLIASIFRPLSWHSSPAVLALLVSFNLTITVLIRQHRFINIMFRMTSLTPFSMPLSFRWLIGKVYHFGGIHSGCAISAMLWLIYLTVSITRQRFKNGNVAIPSVVSIILTYILDFNILVIIVCAMPKLREKYHNIYEMTHRFLGWVTVAIFWAHSIILTRDLVWDPEQSSLGHAFFTSPSPYLLLSITLSLISPWLTLRKVPVQVIKPSDHAIIVSFESSSFYRPFPGSTSSISLTPVREYHSFADIPSEDGSRTRIIISRGGDWTSSVIDNPPTHFWIRSIPTAGAAYVGALFKNTLYVATGSGIGPILPHLLRPHSTCSLFWSARAPAKTYGEDLVNDVTDAVKRQKNEKAVLKIWDTSVDEKPDMVAWTYALKEQCDAEAVVIISNQKLTRKVVYGMEARGVPAFGAIWDS